MDNKTILTDVPYGKHERHRLDIYIPERVENSDGFILFMHGGGWSEGDKSAHKDDALYFCDKGYIAVTMNYRYVSDELNVSDELDDITKALQAIREKISEYGFNTEKFIISGVSAGAHLSLLYAYTRINEAPVIPVAACVYCPPVNCSAEDFLIGITGQFEDWKYEVLSRCCGTVLTKKDFLMPSQQAALKRISPREYVSENNVPTAVFAGKLDELVPIGHIYEFVERLNKCGVKNDMVIYENSGHALDKDPETAARTREIINEYLMRCL